MIDKNIEDLLIRAVHSDDDAKQFFQNNLSNECVLEKILAIVENSESGDARMKGAYWISQFEEDLLIERHEQALSLICKEASDEQVSIS